MHIIGYNSEVYRTMDEAVNGVRGLVAIAVFIEVIKKSFGFFLCILEILNERTQLQENMLLEGLAKSVLSRRKFRSCSNL